MIGVTPIATRTFTMYDVVIIVNSTDVGTAAPAPNHARGGPNAMVRMTTVSISCDTAVDPVARSHSIRCPVSRLIRKNTPMSTYCAVRNATIDAIWMNVAPRNTLSNAAGVIWLYGNHRARSAIRPSRIASPVIANPSRVTRRAVLRTENSLRMSGRTDGSGDGSSPTEITQSRTRKWT